MTQKGEVNSTSTNECMSEGLVQNDEQLTSGQHFLIFATGHCAVCSDQKGKTLVNLHKWFDASTENGGIKLAFETMSRAWLNNPLKLWEKSRR